MKTIRKTAKTLAKALGASVPVLAALALFPELASAATAGEVAGNVTKQFGEIASLISGGAYIMGAGFGVKGALKLRDHNENPQQVKLSAPLTMLAVSGALFALPSVMDTGAETTFGASAKKTNVQGAGL